MTDYVMRVTIFVPTAIRDDANNLAMVLASGPADVGTFGGPTWVDTSGNLYSAASTMARASFPAAATSVLQSPAWDAENVVNMAGARRAQLALVIYDPSAPVTASPDKILAVISDDPKAAIIAAGVSRIAE